MHVEHKFPRGLIDYVVKGEGEQELLTILENHHTIPDSNDITYFGGLKSNLDLNTLPFPDYSDYDLDLYEHADGVSIETSRGCVAKCTFCAETHFWKYRWRESNRVADEMEYQVNKYGINRFWFVDSLAKQIVSSRTVATFNSMSLSVKDILRVQIKSWSPIGSYTY